MKCTINICLLFLFFSCAEKKAEEAPVIPRDKFISLLVEMYSVEGEVSGQTLIDNQVDAKYRQIYLNVFKKNGTDSVQVRKTMDYYKSNPGEFKNILTEVNSLLKKGN